MKSKYLIWVILILVFILPGYLAFRYVDRMCRKYLDVPLSVNVIKEQFSNMTKGANLPKGEWSYGIDISHHQPFVFWRNLKVYTDQNVRTVWKKKNAIKETRIDYVIMKASEGETFRDWRFKRRWKKADKFSYRRGAYHFFRPGKDAEVQAKNYISQVGDIGSDDFPPILDIEKTDGLSAETINKRALEWLQIIEKHYGRKPIIYANPYYLNNILSSEITKNYPVWVANYGVSRPNWNGWHMWQFTDRALVRGVGCADLNVLPLR